MVNSVSTDIWKPHKQKLLGVLNNYEAYKGAPR